jgi:hypothetical protein
MREMIEGSEKSLPGLSWSDPMILLRVK